MLPATGPQAVEALPGGRDEAALANKAYNEYPIHSPPEPAP